MINLVRKFSQSETLMARFLDFKLVSIIRKTLKIRVLSFSLLRFTLVVTLLYNVTTDLCLTITGIS